MNKHRREESEMKSHARHKEMKTKKRMSSGGSAHGDEGFVGEKVKNTHSYDHAHFKGVQKMLDGDLPTTNIATVHACGGGEMHKMPKFAAGGVGKIRKGQY